MKKSTEIRKMKLTELRAYAIELGVDTTVALQKNDDGSEEPIYKKKSHLLEDVLKVVSKNRDDEIRLDDDMLSIIESKAISKAEKARRLSDSGMSIAQITRELGPGTHYSHIHTTVKMYQMKKQLAGSQAPTAESTPVAETAGAES